MIYASPVRDDFVTGAFYDQHGPDFYLSQDKLEADYAPVRYERELRWFRRFCPHGAVLDVGCSTGAFLFQLQSRFAGSYSVTGMDVTTAALDYAETRGIKVIRQPFLEHDFGGQQFEAITFWAVLEHVAEPRRFLNRAVGLLRPGGHLLVLVPNMRSLAVRLLGAKYRYLLPDHINYFTSRTLREMAKLQPDLEVMAMGSSHFNPLVIGQDFFSRAERVEDAERVRLLRQTTALKENPWCRPIKWIYAGTEALLARFYLADNLILVLRKRPSSAGP
jgi:2-polyprenyl-3-methyl-5-hydroxy-6-metoxy-1,4-benzoquinol methylase